MKVLEWHAGRCLRLLVMKTKFWSHVLPLLTEPMCDFDPDKSFECASQIWCISSDPISILWCKAGLQPVIGIIVWNSRTGQLYTFWLLLIRLSKPNRSWCRVDQISRIRYWQTMTRQTRAERGANSITMEKFHRHRHLMTPSWSKSFESNSFQLRASFDLQPEAALCCQVLKVHMMIMLII